jgi:hypothetical protein
MSHHLEFQCFYPPSFDFYCRKTNPSSSRIRGWMSPHPRHLEISTEPKKAHSLWKPRQNCSIWVFHGRKKHHSGTQQQSCQAICFGRLRHLLEHVGPKQSLCLHTQPLGADGIATWKEKTSSSQGFDKAVLKILIFFLAQVIFSQKVYVGRCQSLEPLWSTYLM